MPIKLEGVELEELTIPKSFERPSVSVADTNLHGYRVIIYNDEWHSVDEVVLQLQKATGCDLQKAATIMWEAHTTGRAVCYQGEREDCHRVVRILREIRLQVEVDCD